MAEIKKITINTATCSLCGLCEQDHLSAVFQRKNDGKIHVLNNGIFDLDEHPEIKEIAAYCPTGALCVEDEKALAGSAGDVLTQLNNLIYKELRDYPFEAPDYSEYEYKTGVYQAAPIPVCSRSAKDYFTDDKAMDAGLAEFKQLVWSQSKAIALQYVTAYKTKKVKKYFTYQEIEGNYYYEKNQEIQNLLKKAYQLAMIATDNKIQLPKDFCVFDARLDWKNEESEYNQIDVCCSGLENTSCFYTLDHYRTYINTDGDSRYWYDLTEAETEFRHDMDDVVENVIRGEVEFRVNAITNKYNNRAKSVLKDKIDILQNELKKHIKVDIKSVFEAEIKAVYESIMGSVFPDISAPWPDLDLDYNSDYRFYSERSC